MLPLLVPMLTNVIGGLVAETATDLAKEHVTDMIEKVIPPEAMQTVSYTHLTLPTTSSV